MADDTPHGLPHDPWRRFRAATRARIALGRAGDALPTAALLEFQLAHARARDAVHGVVDFDRVAAELAPWPTIRVHSAASDRAVYLRRPDLGRRLAPRHVEDLTIKAWDWDVVFVVADGLSAAATQTHAAAVIRACRARLEGWRIGPVVLAEQARVALGDEIGSLMAARLVVMLIGERPGLTAADSLGAYLTWAPKPGRLDSERNCVSNIHGGGLPVEAAADKIAWLAIEASRLKLTGVALKEDAPTLAGPEGGGAKRIDHE